MSLIQFHGDIPSDHPHLTEEGLVKGVNEEFAPVLHLPFGYGSLSEEPEPKYYDFYSVRRHIKKGWVSLLPENMKTYDPPEGSQRQYLAAGLILNYASLSFLVAGTYTEREEFNPEGAKPWRLEEPLWNSVLNQFFRVVDYLNFKYLLTHITADVFVEPSGKIAVMPAVITPFAETFEEFWLPSNPKLYSRLDNMILAAEGFSESIVEDSGEWRENG